MAELNYTLDSFANDAAKVLASLRNLASEAAYNLQRGVSVDEATQQGLLGQLNKQYIPLIDKLDRNQQMVASGEWSPQKWFELAKVVYDGIATLNTQAGFNTYSWDRVYGEIVIPTATEVVDDVKKGAAIAAGIGLPLVIFGLLAVVFIIVNKPSLVASAIAP